MSRLQVCQSARYDVILVSFLSQFGRGQPLQLDLADHDLVETAVAVPLCQQQGVRVLLSLGGGQGFTPDSACYYGFYDSTDAESVASNIFQVFIHGSSTPPVTDPSGQEVWPPGIALFDGLVMDLECPTLTSSSNQQLVASFVEALIAQATAYDTEKHTFLAVAPQGYPVYQNAELFTVESSLPATQGDPINGPAPETLLSLATKGVARLDWILFIKEAISVRLTLADSCYLVALHLGRHGEHCYDMCIMFMPQCIHRPNTVHTWCLRRCRASTVAPTLKLFPTFNMAPNASYSIGDMQSWAAISESLIESGLSTENDSSAPIIGESSGIAFWSQAEDQAYAFANSEYLTGKFCGYLYRQYYNKI